MKITAKNIKKYKEGKAFLAYKKVYGVRNNKQNLKLPYWLLRPIILTLLVPADAKVIDPNDNLKKLRTNKLFVLKAEDMKGNEVKNKTFRSWRTAHFRYVVGKWKKVKNLDTDKKEHCGRGLHFFLSKNKARNWSIK